MQYYTNHLWHNDTIQGYEINIPITELTLIIIDR